MHRKTRKLIREMLATLRNEHAEHIGAMQARIYDAQNKNEQPLVSGEANPHLSREDRAIAALEKIGDRMDNSAIASSIETINDRVNAIEAIVRANAAASSPCVTTVETINDRAKAAMDFSEALRVLKSGGRCARSGWNGKGMWLVLIRPDNATHTSAAGAFDMQTCIGMKTAQGTMQPGWLASQADMLAEDWEVV